MARNAMMWVYGGGFSSSTVPIDAPYVLRKKPKLETMVVDTVTNLCFSWIATAAFWVGGSEALPSAPRSVSIRNPPWEGYRLLASRAVTRETSVVLLPAWNESHFADLNWSSSTDAASLDHFLPSLLEASISSILNASSSSSSSPSSSSGG